MEKLKMKITKIETPKNEKEVEIFEAKGWDLEDIANKINEIIDFLNKKESNENG